MPSEKDPSARRLVDGLRLIPSEELPREFSRFEKDDIYFIRHCQYSNFAKGTTYSLYDAIAQAAQNQQQEIQRAKAGGGSSTAAADEFAGKNTAGSSSGKADAAASSSAANGGVDPTEEWVPRCLALTPAALFITDSGANLYRATKYENIKELGFQVTLKKKLFGSEKRLYINIKSDTEPDCYCYLDAEEAKDLTEVFGKIMAARRPKGFTMLEVPESTPIREVVETTIPPGFLTAQEIQKLNQNRVDINDHINIVLQEVNNVQRELETLRPTAEEKRAILKTMEGATTDDLTQLRRRRQELHETHMSLQRTTVAMGVENNKMQQDVARANEQYLEDKNNYEKLVSESVNVADNAALKEQNNMTILRQKAQKRESDKLQQRLEELNAELNSKPTTYTGHDAFAAKAIALEAKITDSLEKWAREMETANKLEKFIDNISTDIDRVDEQLDIQYQKKMDLIAEIEKRLGAVMSPPKAATTAAASSAVDDIGIDDDFAANDSFGIDAVPTTRPRGGPAPAVSSTISSNNNGGHASMLVNGGGADLDDDLLGDSVGRSGGAAVVAPPPPAAAAADIGDDIDDI